jgi:acetylornithine deacetylase/succinyl-diaminopimelate desuccinylase-like protein
MKHLKHLAVTIGPRGSTTPQERQAAEYARQQFEALGLQTHWETFSAPKTGWRPFSVAALFYLLAAIIDLSSVRWLAFALIPIYLIVLGLTWQPDTTPYTQGANDNGSGASIVLSLAERLAHSPLKQIEVWVLCSGCEEVGSHGAQAFVKRHRSELTGLAAINIDNVGGQGAGVCYISVEGMVISYKAALRQSGPNGPTSTLTPGPSQPCTPTPPV